MNMLQAGYAKVDCPPPLGIALEGYYVSRRAEGFLDAIGAAALALTCGGETVLILSADLCFFPTPLASLCRREVEKATGVPESHVFLTATHSHTAPAVSAPLSGDGEDDAIREYRAFLVSRLAEAACLALADRKPAKMGFATATAPDRVAYIRRYRMKDGSTYTCPPIDDPDIVGPIGELDQRVHVLRFARQEAADIVLVNYGVHADTVNGSLLSADWPWWMEKTLDLALDGVKSMFLPGAQGDVGSTNVHPSGGDMNDTEISFDNEMKSPGMARFIGRALAGSVLQVYDKVCFTDVDSIAVVHKTVTVPANVPDPAELPLARKYKALHEAGLDDEIPYKAMQLTTVVAEALRMCEYANGPYTFDLSLMGVRLGNIALVGLPGEPFTEVGVKIKDTEGFDGILPCGLTNGYEGYFPVKSAFDEGGYEAKTSRYRSGVAEAVTDCAKAVLSELKGSR